MSCKREEILKLNTILGRGIEGIHKNIELNQINYEILRQKKHYLSLSTLALTCEAIGGASTQVQITILRQSFINVVFINPYTNFTSLHTS